MFEFQEIMEKTREKTHSNRNARFHVWFHSKFCKTNLLWLAFFHVCFLIRINFDFTGENFYFHVTINKILKKKYKARNIICQELHHARSISFRLWKQTQGSQSVVSSAFPWGSTKRANMDYLDCLFYSLYSVFRKYKLSDIIAQITFIASCSWSRYNLLRHFKYCHWKLQFAK